MTPMRILIADDDVTCRLVLQKTVEKLGHACVAATDGAEAWREFQAAPFDVVITDWMMPGLPGPELCRRVRQRTDDGYTYVILATALGRHENVLEGMEAGADDYLTKPVVPFDLRARLIAAHRVTELHKQVRRFNEELERLNMELAQQARTDALTGLGNRLRLHEDLQSYHERAVRTGRWYCLALCDLDEFKRYNDTYGHIDGDDALRRVAGALGRSTRATDRAYRYGGEEFVVLFANQTLEQGARGAERLRQAVENLGIPHDGRSIPGVMTISVGVSAFDPAGDDPPAALLEAADEALYRAKREGRNRVVPAMTATYTTAYSPAS
jgi:two-component system cell cycle response regulator